MQGADLWRLCEELSIFQAIMLILGYDPSDQTSWLLEKNKRISPPEGYSALKTALSNAVESEKIEARKSYDYEEYANGYGEGTLNIDKTVISISSLKEFLKEKGLVDGFLFPHGGIMEGYLDPQNSNFAPKLSAAINAWKAVTDNPETLKGKTPKQALEKWLRENANKYGLTKDDGSPNETGIQEISKIANWKPEGGAAKTPLGGIVQENPPTPSISPRKLKVFGEREPVISKQPEWDGEELPF